jgi:outer membrane protein assembly factor BamB
MDPQSPLLVAAFGSHVVGIERRTGRRAWHWQSPHATYWTRVTVHAELVVTGANNYAACLAYGTGHLFWQVEIPIAASTLLVDGGELYVASAGEIACLDLRTGAVIWHDPFKGFGVGSVSFGFPGNAAQVDRTGS